jgi:D-glycero-alpha-D-manno-heptose 1-phosphate guanylyltransferase
MNCEAIILAGGLGTRLKYLLNDLPKPMADIKGYPFLHFIFKYLTTQQINSVILSVGYKHESIQNYFKDNYLGIKIQYVIEDSPLGTGGAIKKALEKTIDEVVIINGDTFFPISIKQLQYDYNASKADLQISLKPMIDFDRYGTVEINNEKIITSFIEKKYCKQGLINGGIYYTSKDLIEKLPAKEKFSFENDFMQVENKNFKQCASVFENYFIDIGIPEDYTRAQIEIL